MFEKFRSMMGKGSGDARAKEHYDLAMAKRDEDTDTALIELQAAIRSKPDYFDAHFALGQIYFEKADYDRAVASLNRAVELREDSLDARVGRGMALDKKGDLAGAIADFSRAIEVDPKASSTYLLRGTAYDRRGQPSNAAADYRKVLELTNDPELRKSVGDRLRAIAAQPPGNVIQPISTSTAQAPPRAQAPSQPAPRGSKPLNPHYIESRQTILTTNPAIAGLTPFKEAPHVWGVAMDLGLSDEMVTLVALVDGTTNLYFGGSGGVVDSSTNGAVVAAARDLIIEAERWYKSMAQVSAFPLPGPSTVRFSVLTVGGSYAAEADDASLFRGEHKFSPLFHSAQQVLNEIKRGQH